MDAMQAGCIGLHRVWYYVLPLRIVPVPVPASVPALVPTQVLMPGKAGKARACGRLVRYSVRR